MAPMQACAGQARLLLGTACWPHPSAESARSQVGLGGPGNLSQLLCPVSGKPPAGELPAEPACLCTCPLGFQEADGERPCPQPCRPVSTAQTHRWSGECAAGFLSLLQSPSQPEPAETQEGKLRHAQGPLAEGPSSQGVPSTPNPPGVGGLYRERLTWGRVCSLGALRWCLPVKVCDRRVSICFWGLHRRGCWRAQSSQCLLIGIGEPVSATHSGATYSAV